MSKEFDWDITDDALQSAKDEIVDLVLEGRSSEISLELKHKFVSGEFVRGVIREMPGATQYDFTEGIFIWNDWLPSVTDMAEFQAQGLSDETDIFTEERIEEIVQSGRCSKVEWELFLNWWIQSVLDGSDPPPGEAGKFYNIIPVVSSDGRKCWHLMVSASEGAFALGLGLMDEFVDFFENIEAAKYYLRNSGLIKEDASRGSIVMKFIERNIRQQSFTD